MSRLEGKVAVVTGGASGIGKAIVERFVAEGARVAVGDIDDAGLGALADALGPSIIGVHCDATTEEGPAALVAAAIEEFGRLDIAVANAGVGYLAPIAQHPLAGWQKVIDLTLTGTFLTLKAVAGAIADNGAIVAISSLNAVQPAKGYAAYCAAKAGVIALVDVAALELGERGVRVNAIAPGLVHTPMTHPMWGSPAVEAFERNTALGRHAEPHEIAAAAAFLASDDAGFITGTTLLVDGGAHHLSYPDLSSVARRPVEE